MLFEKYTSFYIINLSNFIWLVSLILIKITSNIKSGFFFFKYNKERTILSPPPTSASEPK